MVVNRGVPLCICLAIEKIDASNMKREHVLAQTQIQQMTRLGFSGSDILEEKYKKL